MAAWALIFGCQSAAVSPAFLTGDPSSTGPKNGNTTGSSPSAPVAPWVPELVRVIDQDFPDPGILVEGHVVWAFSTNAGGKNIPVMSSTDLIHWLPAGDALPTRPSWAQDAAGFIWAPDLIKIGPQDYRMYVSARDTQSKLMCIAVAKASAPQGPYTPVGTAPLTCGFSTEGTLDASVTRSADGSLFLVYKTNGQGSAQKPQIFGRQLTADGFGFSGQEVALLAPSQPWDAQLLEGPNLFERQGQFFLTYSCNFFATANYAIGVGVAKNALGSYAVQSKPLLSSGLKNIIGPGGQTAFIGPDANAYFALHGWDSSALKYRAMYVAPASYLSQNANLPRSF